MSWNSTLRKWQLSKTFGSAGNYSYNISCSKGGYTGQELSSSISIEQSNLFSVNSTSVSPEDNWYSNSTAIFECLASSLNDIKNITLFHNYSGAWQPNLTKEVLGTTRQANFTLTGLAEKSFIWGCYACNNESTCNSSIANRTLTIDLDTPSISFVSVTPKNNSVNITSNNHAYLNVSISDNTNNYSAFIDWNKSLIGWWRFEGNYNDSSSYGNNGSCSNCPALVSGTRGKSYSFDGADDGIDLGLKTPFTSPSTEITISSWVRMDTNYLATKRIIGKATGSQGYDLSIRIDTGEMRASAYFSDTVSSSPLNGNTALAKDRWYHLAATYNGSEARIYVNGVLDGTAQISGNINHSSLQLAIGYNGVNDGYFNGSIDEVMLWNRALSEQEINSSYQAGLYHLENNYTNLDSGTYTYRAYAIDMAGNLNETGERTFRINSRPTISSVSVSPEKPRINESLVCSVSGWSDADNDAQQYHYLWYNNGVLNLTINLSAASHILGSGNTSLDDIWNCTVIPFDGLENGTPMSARVVLNNTLPTVPVLSYPVDGDELFTNRTPLFNWTNSTDADNDPVTYHIEISLTKDFSSVLVNTTSSTNAYMYPGILDFTTYYWRVRANDTINFSSWSAISNFTVAKSVMLKLTNDLVDFGDLLPGTTQDTTDDSPLPLIIRNDGNYQADLVNVSANQSIWNSSLAPLGTKYAQIKSADYESGSINLSSSKTGWVNFSTHISSLVKNLNWTDASDEARIDLKLEVPSDEPYGKKQTKLTFYWEASP